MPSIPGLIYAAHFRLRHPGPVGSGAPSRISPRIHLFVQPRRRRSHRPSDHHSPLGQTSRSLSSAPSRRISARARARTSIPLFLSTNGFRSVPPSSSACARDVGLFFSHIFADTLTALRPYAILSLRHDGHTDRPSRRGASLSVRNRRRNVSIASACLSQFADERYID